MTRYKLILLFFNLFTSVLVFSQSGDLFQFKRNRLLALSFSENPNQFDFNKYNYHPNPNQLNYLYNNSYEFTKREENIIIPDNPGDNYKIATITMNNGDIKTGWIKCNDSISFLLINNSGEKEILYTDVKKITVKSRSTNTNYIFPTICGIYYGLLANQTSSFYISKGERSAPVIALAVSAFGTIIGLFSSNISYPDLIEEVNFDFNQSDIFYFEEINRFQKYINNGPQLGKTTLAIETGYLPNLTLQKLVDKLPELGFNAYHNSEYTNYNILRSFSVSFKVNPDLDLGFAYYSLGDPAITGVVNLSNPKSRINIAAQLQSSGYFIFYNRDFEIDKKSGRCDFNIKAGAGIRAIDFSSNIDVENLSPEGYYLGYTSKNYAHNKILPAMFINPNFRVYVNNHLYLGFNADIIINSNSKFSGIHEINLPGLETGYINYSFGINFGFRF